MSNKALINFNQLLSSKFHGCELLQLTFVKFKLSPTKLLLLKVSLINIFRFFKTLFLFEL